MHRNCELTNNFYAVQAEALQQTRKEVQQLEVQLQEQLMGQEQLAAERDSFKAGAHAAADQSKV